MSVIVRVIDKLPVIAAESEAKVAAALAKAAFDTEALMKQKAPSPSQGPAGGIYSTGFLRSAINSQQNSPLQWQVNSPAEYSIYIELGTYKMSAFPYVTPTMEEMRPKILADLAAAVLS